MANDKEEDMQKQVLSAFKRIGEVWGQTRKGIIVTFNGARVGEWVWNQGHMMVKAENKDFRSVVRDLQENGILVQEPVPALNEPQDNVLPGIATSLTTIPLGAAGPGVLDHALKMLGYLLMDLDVGIIK